MIVFGSLALATLAALVTTMALADIADSKQIDINDLGKVYCSKYFFLESQLAGYNVDTALLVPLSLLARLSPPQPALLTYFSILLTIGLNTLFFQLDLVISGLQVQFRSYVILQQTNSLDAGSLLAPTEQVPALQRYPVRPGVRPGVCQLSVLTVQVCGLGFGLSLCYTTQAGQFLLYTLDTQVCNT